jgi:hypothetical protein
MRKETDEAMTTEAGGGVPQDDGLLELRDTVLDFLWRVYGYPGPFADAHPVTVDKYRDDADDLLDLIETAGYEIQPTERVERLRAVATKYQALDVGMIGLLPGDLAEPGGRE